MALLVRRSVLLKSFIVVLCLFVLVCVAPAQHAGSRVAATRAPVPASPINHSPVYRPPIYQPPVYRAPSYAPISASSISAVSAPRIPGAVTFRPPFHPIRPFPPTVLFYPFPIFSGPFWPSNFCWWATCDQFWVPAFFYNAAPIDQWNPINVFPAASETPVYGYGLEGPEIPQLFLKDGTILNVTDYWLVDDQLHFMIVEGDGMKVSEQVIAFDALDLQKTVDVDSQRGFRFMLRNEPFEQYVRDHPEEPTSDPGPRNQ